MSLDLKLRWLACPSVIKQISRPLLCRFLSRHRRFLARHGVRVSRNGFDEDGLICVLAAPPRDMPPTLLNALAFVDEMAGPDTFDQLVELAESLGLRVREHATPADVALRVWLADPSELEARHALHLVRRGKTFRIFRGKGSGFCPLPPVTRENLMAMETDLNEWFHTLRRGRGTRVYVFERDDAKWFLVRRGEPCVRLGSLETGQSVPIHYRPERFDLVLYNPRFGSIGVCCDPPRATDAYCRVLGRYLFRDDEYFKTDLHGHPFSLAPITEQGRACLACSDVDGIDRVRLIELEARGESGQFHTDLCKADDVFRVVEEAHRRLPAPTSFRRGRFAILFSDDPVEQHLTIQLPNIVTMDHGLNIKLIEQWMWLRRFICPPVIRQDANASGVLEVS